LSPAAVEVVTIRDLRKITGKTDVTIGRWVKRRDLPEPEHLNGLRVWKLAEVLAALERLRAKPPRSIPAAGVGRERGHSLRDEFAELKAAAAEALACAGVAETGRILARHTASGRLTEIPVNARRAAILDLRRLVERFA